MTNSNSLAVVQDRTGVAPTVLGRGPVRIPVGGSIRAGIKVLTKAVAENPRVVAIYEDGVKRGVSFDDIEKAIKKEFPDLKPLTPKNVPYFTARPGDFPNPEVARQILNRYGEDKGDGVKRLYRFPVVFPADQWQTVMPHELVAWGANERKFWSEYSPDGRMRYCKCHSPVPMDASGRKPIRLFGGRKAMLRAENGGICDPEHCKEYQNRQCNLAGRFLFFIPGIESLEAIQLPTNSFYSMQAAIDKFEMIGFMRGGRISGFLDGRNTPFYLSKELKEVPHIDDDGRAVRVKQWLITLEAPVDVTSVLRLNEPDDLGVLPAADSAVGIFEGPGNTYDDAIIQHGQDDGAHEHDGEDGSGLHTGSTGGAAKADAKAPQANGGAAGTPGRSAAAGGEAGLEDVTAALAALGFSLEAYTAYADKKYGAGWKRNAGGRNRALTEIQSFGGDGAALKAKIDGELCFS